MTYGIFHKGNLMSKAIAKPAMAVDWVALLHEAVNVPGLMHDAYRAFHNFSIGNQMLAASQLRARGLPINPLATFKQWIDKGRAVKKGEKAISLIRPITVKKRLIEAGEPCDEDGETRTIFVPKPNWFSLDQTEGEPFVQETQSTAWDVNLALNKLGITRVPFDHINGNCLGWALPSQSKVSCSDLAPFPLKTLMHEIAHCKLHAGRDEETFVDGSELCSSLKEVEAESCAYLVCSALGLSGGEYCRHYIQSWLAGGGGEAIPEVNAKRIIRCANEILAAGFPAKQSNQEVPA